MNDLEIAEIPKATTVSSDVMVEMKYDSMVVMKILGVKYKEIAKKVGFHEGHVKKLFMNGGKLRKRYEAMASTVAEKSSEEAMLILFSNLPDIARSMVLSAKQYGTPVGVMAGKTIFEQTLGKPTERSKTKTNINTPFGSFAEWAKAETVKEQEELKQQQNGQGEVETIPEEPK